MVVVGAERDADGGNRGFVDVLFQIEGGKFGSPSHYYKGLNGVSPRFVTIGDFDGNRRPDIAVSYVYDGSPTFGTLSVMWNRGDGTFSEPKLELGSFLLYNFGGLGAADFDGDGRSELVLLNGLGLPYISAQKYDTAAQKFLAATPGATLGLPLGWVGTAIELADLNGDKIPDLIVERTDGNKAAELALYITEKRAMPMDPFVFTERAKLAVPGVLGRVAVGELVAPAGLDLLRSVPATVSGGVTTPGSTVQVMPLTQGGSGPQFSTPVTTHTVGALPFGVALGRYAGSPLFDVAVTHAVLPPCASSGACAKQQSIAVLINNQSTGLPTLAARLPELPVGSGESAFLCSVDIDGNGTLDLVAASSGDATHRLPGQLHVFRSQL